MTGSKAFMSASTAAAQQKAVKAITIRENAARGRQKAEKQQQALGRQRKSQLPSLRSDHAQNKTASSPILVGGQAFTTGECLGVCLCAIRLTRIAVEVIPHRKVVAVVAEMYNRVDRRMAAGAVLPQVRHVVVCGKAERSEDHQTSSSQRDEM